MLLSPRFAGIVAALIFACWVRSAIRDDQLDWNRNGFAMHLESCSGFIVVAFQPNDRPDAFETTSRPEHFGYQGWLIGRLKYSRRGAGQRDDWTRIDIPFWFILFGFLLAHRDARRFTAHMRRKSRLARGLCPHCGYDLRGGHKQCPECGAPCDD